MYVIRHVVFFICTRRYFASTMGFRVKLSVMLSLFCEIEITTISRSVKIRTLQDSKFQTRSNCKPNQSNPKNSESNYLATLIWASPIPYTPNFFILFFNYHPHALLSISDHVMMRSGRSLKFPSSTNWRPPGSFQPQQFLKILFGAAIINCIISPTVSLPFKEGKTIDFFLKKIEKKKKNS